MVLEEITERIKYWLNGLVKKDLNYITGRNVAVIDSIDWSDDGKIIVSRGEGSITIRYERIELVLTKLLKGAPVHVDTILRSGSNDRSVIETILANLPPVGFMKANQGRNKTRNKVIQWLNKDIHDLGEILNISENEYKDFILNSSVQEYVDSLSKPFLLLAGISGTGKTRFVRKQAEASGNLSETFCLTSVRPDWHEPSDLLGYISRLNGQAEYITTDVLQFIAKAWRAMLDAGLVLSVKEIENQGEQLVISGEKTDLVSVLPYWLCLDEMNLAPVEQYFADYLSVLETREWCWENDSFIYLCDPLIKATTINQVADTDKLRNELGFSDENYDESWPLFCKHGLGIPFNLIVAGTVNMDETTHGFSRKVIDRALSFDFGKFFPNNFSTFFEPNVSNKILNYPIFSHANELQDKLPDVDPNGQKSIDFLTKINTVLNDTPFELAYRALNELLLAVICAQPETPLHLQAVWDDFLMCKVLPRIEGDSDKLSTNSSGTSLLTKLITLLEVEFAGFWNETNDASKARPDLYREKKNAGDDGKTLRIACRSKVKLEWMQERLTQSTFTSFWP